MRYYRISILLIFMQLAGSINILSGCSCIKPSVCDMLTDENIPYIVFKGHVVLTRELDSISTQYRDYMPTVMYVKVDQYFRNELNLTDTIKIYGDDSNNGDCVNDMRTYEIGREIYWGMNPNLYENNEIPDDTINTNYSSLAYFSCGISGIASYNNTSTLYISNQRIVAPRSYLDLILNEKCDLDIESLVRSVGCEIEDVIFYPNPTKSGEIRIKELEGYVDIGDHDMTIYDANGRIVHFKKAGWVVDLFRPVIYTIKKPGIYFIRYGCNYTSFTKKIIYTP